MRERTELLIRGMTENRTKRHRWLAMVTALAFLTGGNVFWSLREIGTAVTEDDLCTREAHEHSEECYDENGDLICGKEEHVHTAACFSDENADVETAEIWEATIPEREGLSRQEQAALIAESQLGYAESTNNFILGEDGVQHGYTRYGAWYGNPYGEWNTMFTYFCLYYAGVSAEEIPCIGNARTWQVKLSECGLIHGPDTEPERGEVILLDLDADGEADLTGIITDAAETLHFVEGDLGHAVAVGELAPDAEQILGFVAIPEPDTPDAENPEASPPDESPPEDADESSPDAEPAPTEEQPVASESKQPLVTYRAEAPSGIQVSAVAAEGVFPADTVMTVTDVPREEALEIAANSIASEPENLDAIAVDISFLDADGNEIEPDAGSSVQVQIVLSDALRLYGDDYALLHVADSGEVQKVENVSLSEIGVEFETESFSVFVFVGDTPKALNTLTMVNGQTGGNSSANPYIVHVGDTVDIFMDGTEWYFVNGTNTQNGKEILKKTVEKYSTSITYQEGEGSSQHDVTVEGIRGAYKALQAADVSLSRSSGDTIYLRVRDSFFFADGSNATLFKDLEMLDTYSSDNSSGNPYTIYVGDSIDIFLSGTGDFTVDRSDLLSVGSTAFGVTVTCDGEQYTGTRKTLTGLQKGNVKISNGVDDIYIRVIEKFFVNEPIGGQKDMERLILAENNLPGSIHRPSSEDNPYIIYVGERLEVEYQGQYVGNGNITVLYNDDVGEGKHNINRIGTGDDVSTSSRKATFEGSTPGTCRIIMRKSNNGDNSESNIVESLWVKVVDPIQVKTLLSDKPKDQIREYLPNQRLPDKNGYVQNAEGTAWRTTAYRLRVGDDLRLFSNQEGTFTMSTTGNLEMTGTDGKYTVFRGTAAGKVKITHTSTNGDIDEMWVQVVGAKECNYNHSDIEIADGGTYSVSNVTFDEEGHKITTVKVYDAYIDEVNECRLLDENDELVERFIPENYEKRGSPGETQYEITSAYRCMWTKHFDPCRVKRTIFDVDVKLFPKREYKVDENGSIYDDITLSGEAETAPHVIFDLGQQSIIDAINKCPMANGFDFTARANAALIQLTANKEVIDNLPLKNEQFEFELVSAEVAYKALKIGTTGGNGQITSLTCSPESVFPGLNASEQVEVYELFNHTSFSFEASNSFNLDSFKAEYDPSASVRSVGDLIDSFVIGGTPTTDEQHFYDVISKCLYPARAILPENDGYFHLSNGHYLFRKSSPNAVIATAKNDADGNIAFDHQLFDKPGTYELMIREKNTSDLAVKTYDTHVYPVTVTVRDDMSIDVNFHTTDHKPPTFINELNTYRLPDTGGAGTLPWYLGGTVILAAASLLLIKKRREGS